MKKTSLRYVLLFVFSLLFLFAIWSGLEKTAVSHALPNAVVTPQEIVSTAWKQSQQATAYSYDTTILQTTWPVPRLENAGLSATEERLYLQGQNNLQDETMQIRLWANGGNVATGQESVEIQVRDGQAQGRSPNGEWEDLGDFTALFAPDNDLFTYLIAAENVTELSDERQPPADSSVTPLSYTRYGFSIDGVTFASYMRDQLQAELQRTGELPPGITLESSQHYANMNGQGELWVNATGNPIRQIIRLNFPADEWKRIDAEITTTFSQWEYEVVEKRPFTVAALVNTPSLTLGTLGTTLTSWIPADLLSQAARPLILLVVALLLFSLCWRYWQSPQFYRVVSVILVISILSSPFLPIFQAKRAYAFQQDQQQQFAAYNASQEEKQQAQQLQNTLTTTTFDPHVSPLATAPIQTTTTDQNDSDPDLTKQPQCQPTPSTLNANDSGLDSDNDGLTDAQEDECGTNASIEDTDGDGLNDGIEILEIGTNPLTIDTDGDFISDKAEVIGFTDDNLRDWYLNPREADSNKDGQPDNLDCTNLIDVAESDTGQLILVSPAGSYCEDRDGDAVPDVWDNDNDGDGVPDRSDLSTNSYRGDLAAGLTGFDFVVNDLMADEPVTVDFQLRPTNPDHLWYSLNYLDWPTDDRLGQIQRVFDTEFTDPQTGLDAGGDIRTTPMLEIEIPYDEANGRYGSLPLQPGVTTIRPTDVITTWLDAELADSFGVTVSKKDESGDILQAYVPLNLVREWDDNSPVAFSGRMFYRPDQADGWGQTQTARLVWLVEGITDYCLPMPTDYSPPGVADEDLQEYWCSLTSHWRSADPVILHTYDDPWVLTGFSVREDHGVKAMVSFESPPDVATYDSSSYYEKYLWELSDHLDSTFIGGREDANGERDVDLNEIYRRFDSRTNNDGQNDPTDDELWGIPRDSLMVENTLPEFEHQSLVATIPIYTNIILQEHFTPIIAQGKSITPTLLVLREEMYRIADMSGLGDSANTTTLDMTGEVATTAVMNWIPYTYNSTAADLQYAWEPVDLDSYWQHLGNVLNTDSNLPTVWSDAEELNQATATAQTYYMYMFDGPARQVQLGSVPTPEAGVQSDSAMTAAVSNQADYTRGAAGLVKNIYSLYEDTYNSKIETSTWKRNTRAALIVIAVATFALQEAGVIGENIGETIMGAVSVVAGGAAISSAYGAYKGADAALQSAKLASKTTAVAIAVIVTVGIAVALFALQVQNMPVGSIEYNHAVAGFVATLIVSLLLLAISIANPAGMLLAGLLALADGVVAILCGTGVVDGGICAGFTGLIIAGLTESFHHTNPATKLERENRLNFTGLSFTLEDEQMGYMVGNDVQIHLGISNTLKPLRANDSTKRGVGSIRDQVRNTNLIYEFMDAKISLDDQVIGNGESPPSSAWQQGKESYYYDVLGGGRWQYYWDWYTTAHVTQTFTYAGINVSVGSDYLAEGSAVRVLECTFIVVGMKCEWRNIKSTSHIPMDPLVFDVFPANIGEFYQLTTRQNGWALDWAEDFPILRDADGDGLDITIDPNDSNPDSDADGLSDFFELSQDGTKPQTDPLSSDSDNDGLSDYDEQIWGTDPTRADTDNDGLRDGDEIFHYNKDAQEWQGGWLYTYDFDASDKSLQTRIIADPLTGNYDADAYSDREEYINGFNPWVNSTSGIMEVTAHIRDEDRVVRPGATIPYSVTVENKLQDRYELGLLDVDFPEASGTENLLPLPFRLQPDRPNAINTITQQGEVVVNATLAQSQQISLTNIAGANRVDFSGVEGEDRTLWLQLNDSDNSNFIDASPYQRTITCSSNCPEAGESGYAGNAVKFEQGEELPLGTTTQLDMSGDEFTLMAWMKPALYDANDAQPARVLDVAGWNVTLLPIDSNTLRLSVYKKNGSLIYTNQFMRHGSWYHIAFRYHANQMEFFLNGEWVDSAPVGGNGTINGNVKFGEAAIPANATDFFIDEVEVYSIALPDSDIKDRLTAPILHLTFDNYPVRDTSPFQLIDIECGTSSNNHIWINCPQRVRNADPSYGWAEFDQNSSYTVMPSQNLRLGENNKQFTIATRIKPEQNDGHWHAVLGTDENRDQSGAPILEVRGRSLRLTFSQPRCEFQTDNRIEIDSWQHVAVTVSDTTVTWYVDGEQVDAQPINNTSCIATMPLNGAFTIGRAEPDYFVHFDKVEIDEHDPGDESNNRPEMRIFYNNTTAWTSVYDIPKNSTGDRYTIVPINETRTISPNSGGYFVLCEFDRERDYCKTEASSKDDEILMQRVLDNTMMNDERTPYTDDDWADPDPVDGYRGGDGDGYFSWELYNGFFKGSLDDFRLYNYGLTADEVANVYLDVFNNPRLEIRFDEAPSSQVFYDSSGTPFDATCAQPESCPESGHWGRINQAVYFDGIDDYVSADAAIAGIYANDFAFSAWVKPDSRINTSAGGAIMALGGLSVRYLNNGRFALVDSDETVTTEPFTSGEWHHVMVWVSESQVSFEDEARLYVDGVLINSLHTTLTAADKYNAFKIGQAGSYSNPDHFFMGHIDQVSITESNGWQWSPGASQLVREAPYVTLHFDETAGSQEFVNDAIPSKIATCIDPGTGFDITCPNSGINGQMYGAASFNEGTLNNNAVLVPGRANSDLTIAMWVKPTKRKNSDQALISKPSSNDPQDDEYGDYTLLLTPDLNMRFRLCSSSPYDENPWITTTAQLSENQWNHVVVTIDTPNSFSRGQATLYLNGSEVGQKVYRNDLCYYGPNTLIEIGHSRLANEEASTIGSFAGQIDELVLYGKTLNRSDVDELYNYQVSWFDTSFATPIIVDAQPPTVEISNLHEGDSLAAEATKGYVVIVDAQDDLSGVEQVEYMLDNGSWQAATLNNTWAFTLTNAPLAAGSHQLAVRAVDGVDYQSAEAMITFAVDDTPPIATLDQIGLQPVTAGTLTETQAVSLSGTIADDMSGVASLQLTVLTLDGVPMGNGGKTAVLTNNQWHATYPFTANPNGSYIVELTAVDNAGNTTVTQANVSTPLLLDTTAPKTHLDLTGLHTNTLSGATSLTGFSSDLPQPTSTVLSLNFEEAVGATAFADSTANQNTATCDLATCPQPVAGQTSHGQALNFDGTTYLNIVDPVDFDFGTGSFSISLWFNRPAANAEALLSREDGDNAFSLLFNPDNTLAVYLKIDGQGGVVVNNGTPFTLNEWHHATVVRDDSGQLTTYIDGIPNGSSATPFSLDMNQISPETPLALGAFFPGYLAYGGLMDEVQVFDRALSGTEINHLAQPVVTGVADVEIAYTPIQDGSPFYNEVPLDGLMAHYPFTDDGGENGTPIIYDVSGNDRNGTCQGACAFESEGHDGTAVRFNGANTVVTLPSITSPDNIALSIGGWFYPDQTTGNSIFKLGDKRLLYSREQFIYTDDDTSSLYGSRNREINNWYHLMLVFDTAGNTTLYVNGVADISAQTSGTTTLDPIKIGSQSLHAYMDEVQLYDRVLDVSEVVSLYQGSSPILIMGFKETSISDGTRLADTSGWAHDGLFVNQQGDNSQNKAVTGAVGRTALSLDGVDDYVEIPHASALNTQTAIAIAAWLNPDNWQGNQSIVQKGDGDTQYHLSAQGNQLTFALSGVGTVAATLPSAGDWQHVTAVYDGQQVQLWINGQLGATQPATGLINTTSDPLFIGNQFAGLMDEVRIYPRALSAPEINALNGRWQSVPMSDPAGSVLSGWNTTLPTDLEGYYQIDLRSRDAFGQVGLNDQDQWRGMIDTLAPRVTLNSTFVNTQTLYTAVAEDFNLTAEGFTSPCGAGVYDTAEYIQSPWYLTLTDNDLGDNAQLYRLEVSCLGEPGPITEVGAEETLLAAKDVAVSGNYAYVADSSRGLQIIDVTNPAVPVTVGSYLAPPNYARGVAVQGNYAYVANNEDGLRIIDVQNPTAPTLAGHYNSGKPNRVIVAGSYAYVATVSNGVVIVDVSNPASPVLAGQYLGSGTEKIGYASDVAVSGDYLYVADYQKALFVIDISDRANPVFVNKVTTTGRPFGLAVDGDYVYLADFYAGIHIFDVSSPATPVEVASHPAGYAFDVAVQDGYAYVADYYKKMWVIDVTNPTAPSLEGYYDTPGAAYGLTTAGIYAYVADSTGSLRIASLFGGLQAIAYDSLGNKGSAAVVGTRSIVSETAVFQSITPPPIDIAFDSVPRLLTSYAPADFVILANSALTSSLQSMTVSMNDVSVWSQNWTLGTISQTMETIPWTPVADGVYTVKVTVTDWGGNSVTAEGPSAIIVDTTAPGLSLDTQVFTRTHIAGNGKLSLSGALLDDGGLTTVAVQVDGQSIPATFTETGWQANWFTDQANPADGLSYAFTAQATDIAGYTTAITETLWVDVVAPQPVTLTLTSNGAIIEPSMTLRTISPTLTLTWTAGIDGSGLADYVVEWQSRPSYTDTITAVSSQHPPTSTLASTFQPGIAQRVDIRLISQDNYGNTASQDYGWLVVDAPLTPDYVTLTAPPYDDQPIQSWQDASCALVGTDQRIDLRTSELASQGSSQFFYTSWDETAVRLAWVGANWDNDGDLFVYLDSQPGGATQTYDPYPATMNETAIYLPGVPPANSNIITPWPVMEADHLIWVEDSYTAWHLVWDGQAWVVNRQLNAAEFRADGQMGNKQTDLYLSFDLLGIADPSATSLGVVALASEEDQLRLWSTMPPRNPVNSDRVINNARFSPPQQVFGLREAYQWPSLGANLCANGSQPLAGSPNTYADNAVQFSISFDPVGTSYRFLQDDLFFLWGKLFGGRTADVSTIFEFTDISHPLLAPEQEITYTVQYQNQGTATAEGLQLDISSYYGLALPDGQHLPAEFRDSQQIVIGDVAPGASGAVSFRAVVDLDTARQDYYEPCVTANPTDAARCAATYLAWGSVDAFVNSSQNSTIPPLEWLWVDHQIDYQAPVFFGIQSPERFISSGDNAFDGYAYDASGVPTVTLEIQSPAGGTVSLLCPDDTPANGRWACDWNATTMNNNIALDDGDVFMVRTQAVDGFDQASESNSWQTFIVDTIPPAVTLLQTAVYSGQIINLNKVPLYLSGQVADKHGVGGVEVCLDGICQQGNLVTENISNTIITDEPATAVLLDGTTQCEINPVVRAFTVADNFAIGSVTFGFNATHTQRDNIQAELVSPAGTRVTLLNDDYILGTQFQNLDVLLFDAALNSLADDRTHHNITSPYYDQQVRPYAPLNAFAGENSIGEWQLILCDNGQLPGEGVYQRGQLTLMAENTAVTQSEWRYASPRLTAALDDVTKNVTVWGIDLAGNRNLTEVGMSVRVDNIAPVITITQTSPKNHLLAGQVTDGSGIKKMSVFLVFADGRTHTELIRVEADNSWHYTLPVGEYELWITAVDFADNTHSVGALLLDVPRYQVWAPIVFNE